MDYHSLPNAISIYVVSSPPYVNNKTLNLVLLHIVDMMSVGILCYDNSNSVVSVPDQENVGG